MRSALPMVVTLVLAAVARGQAPAPALAPIPAADLAPTFNEPVRQAVDDICPLAVSLWKVEPGLGQGSSFEQVYRYGDGFLRAQGGLYAVFDTSVYTRDRENKDKLVPVVPPGTRYYIGAPPPLPRSDAPPSTDRIDGRVNGRVDPAPVRERLDGKAPQREPWAAAHAAPPATPAPLASPAPPGQAGAIIADSRYRAQRLQALMHRAAQVRRAPAADQAAVGRSSSSSSQ